MSSVVPVDEDSENPRGGTGEGQASSWGAGGPLSKKLGCKVAGQLPANLSLSGSICAEAALGSFFLDLLSALLSVGAGHTNVKSLSPRTRDQGCSLPSALCTSWASPSRPVPWCGRKLSPGGGAAPTAGGPRAGRGRSVSSLNGPSCLPKRPLFRWKTPYVL